MKNFIIILGAIPMLLLTHSTYAQNVPSKITYQGILWENGSPVTTSRNLSFAILSNNIPIWTENHNNVNIDDGRYMVILRETNPLTIDHFEGKANVALQITVNNATVLAPTIALLTVPHAFYAQKAEDANHLNGKDSSYYLMPPGTIVPYAGITAPEGWLLCDGSEINRVTYQRLFNNIGTNYGSGNGVNTFHLPDTRGRFLRGVSENTNNDPDKNSRYALHSGGKTGNHVGSYQDDATAMPNNAFSVTIDDAGKHSHDFKDGYDYIRKVEGYDKKVGKNNVTSGEDALGSLGIWTASGETDEEPDHTHTATISNGDPDTHPTNVYVNYIIKY